MQPAFGLCRRHGRRCTRLARRAAIHRSSVAEHVRFLFGFLLHKFGTQQQTENFLRHSGGCSVGALLFPHSWEDVRGSAGLKARRRSMPWSLDVYCFRLLFSHEMQSAVQQMTSGRHEARSWAVCRVASLASLASLGAEAAGLHPGFGPVHGDGRGRAPGPRLQRKSVLPCAARMLSHRAIVLCIRLPRYNCCIGVRRQLRRTWIQDEPTYMNCVEHQTWKRLYDDVPFILNKTFRRRSVSNSEGPVTNFWLPVINHKPPANYELRTSNYQYIVQASD